MADDMGKESFVQNLNGTSILEVAGIVSYAPLCCLLYFIVQTSFLAGRMQREAWYDRATSSLLIMSYTRPIVLLNFPIISRRTFTLIKISAKKRYVFLIENTFLAIPNLLILTIFDEHVWLLNGIQLTSCAIIAYGTRTFSPQTAAPFTYPSEQYVTDLKRSTDFAEKKLFVSNYRAFMNIATVLSILSVDFKVFPRRFAKAETYGTGFMDIGVGSFIFGHAIISQFARGTMTRTNQSLKGVLLKHFMGCIPILFLGIVRLISIKGTNYYEHVTEYGVHWNFFFTLAFVKFVAGSITQLLHNMTKEIILVFGIALCFLYECLLNNYGLKDYLQNGSAGDGSRDNLIDANREGLISCIGYTGLFLIASHLGTMIFIKRSKVHLLKALVKIDIFLWLSTISCKLWIDDVSRQMANLSYVLWILSLNVYLLVCFLVVEMIQASINGKWSGSNRFTVPSLSPRRGLHQKEAGESLTLENRYNCREPLLVKAISRNQLTYFLLGNVLTGIINLSVNTIRLYDFAAMTILIAYVFITNGVIVLLHLKNINTKLW